MDGLTAILLKGSFTTLHDVFVSVRNLPMAGWTPGTQYDIHSLIAFIEPS